jgi:hypothetical protein
VSAFFIHVKAASLAIEKVALGREIIFENR